MSLSKEIIEMYGGTHMIPLKKVKASIKRIKERFIKEGGTHSILQIRARKIIDQEMGGDLK